MRCCPQSLTILLCLVWPMLSSAETFRLATFNIENYLDRPTESRPKLKSAESKAKVREMILTARPDVIALQEIGDISALMELRGSLQASGLVFPHWEHVRGFDTNIFVAVLSRFPITARRSQTNASFLLSGRRFQVSRGFVEIDVQVNERYTFTLMAAHLKSKRPSGFADEEELRHEEAKLLRKFVEANLARNPDANLVLVGDLNDTQNSASVRTLAGRGRMKLQDTRPAERTLDRRDERPRATAGSQRSITWTHFFATEDTYSRFDYVLVSPGMAREWIAADSGVLAHPDWGMASDHRLVFATFEAANR